MEGFAQSSLPIRPRTLRVADPREPLLIYTDGFLEGDQALWRVFVIDQKTRKKFSFCLDRSQKWTLDSHRGKAAHVRD